MDLLTRLSYFLGKSPIAEITNSAIKYVPTDRYLENKHKT